MKLISGSGSILLLSLLIITGASCKKKDDDPVCRIVTITDAPSSGSGFTCSLTYNNDGNVSTLVRTTGSTTVSKVFTYSSNTIIINSTTGGSFSGRDSVTLNSNNRITNIRHYTNVAGTTWYNNYFEYNSNGELLKETDTQSGGGSSTSDYTYTNGDLVQAASGISVSTYEYYTDKAYQEGDFFHVIYLINYGVPIIKNAHLVKNVTSGSNLTNYSYEMNDKGHIAKLTVTGGTSTDVISYQYQCN